MDTATRTGVSGAAGTISPDQATLGLTTYGRTWLFRHFTADSFFNGTAMYVDYSATGSDTITRGYEGIEFNNNDYINLCVDGINERILGLLADSIALWVKHDGNGGPGSLRNAALCADHGDTIRFKATLIQDTIHLSTGPLVFNADISMIQPAGQPIYIQSAGSSIFSISPGLQLMLREIRILCGDPNASAMINGGSLYLEDVEITQSGNQNPAINNYGFLDIKGNCFVK